MAEHKTTTSQLPAEVQEKYEIVGHLEGGPKFDLPAQNMYGVDFTKLSLTDAAVLVRRKFKYLREKQVTQPKPVASKPVEKDQ